MVKNTYKIYHFNHFQVYSSVVLSTFISYSQSTKFLSFCKTKTVHIKQLKIAYFSQTLATTNPLYFISMNVTTLSISYTYGFIQCFHFVSDLFHLAWCPPGSSMLYHVSEFLYFQGWIIFYICVYHIFKSIYLSLGTWVLLGRRHNYDDSKSAFFLRVGVHRMLKSFWRESSVRVESGGQGWAGVWERWSGNVESYLNRAPVWAPCSRVRTA